MASTYHDALSPPPSRYERGVLFLAWGSGMVGAVSRPAECARRIRAGAGSSAYRSSACRSCVGASRCCGRRSYMAACRSYMAACRSCVGDPGMVGAVRRPASGARRQSAGQRDVRKHAGYPCSLASD